MLFVGTGLCCINVRERECVLFLGVVQHFFLVWKRGSALFLGSQPMLVVQVYWYLLWLLLVEATLYLLGGNRLYLVEAKLTRTTKDYYPINVISGNL